MEKKLQFIGLTILLGIVAGVLMGCNERSDSSDSQQPAAPLVHAIAPVGSNTHTITDFRVGCGHDIDPSTVNASSFYTTPVVSGQLEVRGSYIHFTPDAELATSTEYTVHMSAAICYTSGAPINAYSWTFTTADHSSGEGTGGGQVGGGGGGSSSALGAPTVIETVGFIRDMTPGGTPQYIYGIEELSQSLHRINTVTKAIDKTTLLPFEDPYAMAYSDVDNALYITSIGSAAITVYDIDTDAIHTIALPSIMTGFQIEVAPGLRRIYFISLNSPQMELLIVDMDTEVVVNRMPIAGDFFALKESGEHFFSGEWAPPGSRSTLNRYSVAGDDLTLEQSDPDAGEVGRSIAISPDGRQLIFVCEFGNDDEDGVASAYDLDPYDLTVSSGQWDFEPFLSWALFHPSGSRLYIGRGTCGSGDSIQVVNPATHRIIETVRLEKAWCSMGMTTNSDGSVLAVPTYNNVQGTGNRLYLMDVLDVN